MTPAGEPSVFLDACERFRRLGDGFELEIDPVSVLRNVNGGYIGAFALHMAGSVSHCRRPASVDVNFIRPLRAGPARVELAEIFTSPNAQLLSLLFLQGDRPRATAHVWCVNDAPAPALIEARMPLAPRPGELRTLEEVMGPEEPPLPAFWRFAEQRPVARTQGRRVRTPRLLRWFRFIGDRQPDNPYASLSRALPLIDTMGLPAARQGCGGLPDGPTPTLRLSVQFNEARDSGPWLLAETGSDFAGGGLVTAWGRVWDEDGALIASGLTELLRKGARGSDAETADP